MKGVDALLVIGLLFATAPRLVAAEHEDAAVPPTAGPFGGLGEKVGREMELRGIQDTLKASEEQRRRIEAQVEAQRADRARLNDALIKTTTRVRNEETRINEAEQRINVLIGSEDAIRRSLAGRRAVITEVLAALQRMGRKSPPAVLVEPEDILRAIRTSMLLGAVLPELRAETEALASDLAELIQLRQTIAEERDALARDIASLNDERLRLAALVEVRQSALAQAEQALGAERERASALAHQAVSLKDLITGMEKEITAAARAAAAARQAEEAHKKAELEGQKAKLAMAPFNDPSRLAPAIPFADAKGLLPLPVSGTLVKAFGDSDGIGGTEKGISIATRAGAPVASPVDGWVAFSGPYRTYGQLLIINAGAGYYIVLAGMDRISIDVGQFVLAGEPVAVMGDGSARAAAAIAIGDARPILYVEFRKDGVAIDPGPWWAKPELQKVRG
jgi:septal ring factor EnvC (AmiA/AmiB activator)